MASSIEAIQKILQKTVAPGIRRITLLYPKKVFDLRLLNHHLYESSP